MPKELPFPWLIQRFAHGLIPKTNTQVKQIFEDGTSFSSVFTDVWPCVSDAV